MQLNNLGALSAGVNSVMIGGAGVLAPGANTGIIAGPLTVNLGSTAVGVTLASGASMLNELGVPGQSNLLHCSITAWRPGVPSPWIPAATP